MKKTLLFISAFSFSLLVFAQQTPYIIQRDDEEEEDGRREFEKWYESIHKAASGVDWRKMEEETRYSKYLALLKQEKSSDKMQAQEILANGNLMGQWNERGSRNQAGRTGYADFDAATGDVYCTSAGGNVWKGNLAGTNWKVLNDKLPFQASMLRVIPNGSNKRVIAAVGATGKVYYTDNDGQTWQISSGLSTISSIKRGVVLDDVINTIYILAQEDGPTTTIYKSTDQGTSFSLIASYPQATYPSIDNCDIWAPHYGSSDLTFIQKNSIYSINSTTDAKTFVSTFTLLADGYTVLSGYKDVSSFVLYAYVNPNVYKSTDGGYNWTYVNNIGGGASYSFMCSCTNPNNLYYGDLEAHYSKDAGLNWSLVNAWQSYFSSPSTLLHADIGPINSLKNAQGKEINFIATDGGLYISYDSLTTVKNITLNGFNISQYYSVYTNKNNTNYIYAGAQDQGLQRCINSSGTTLGFTQVIVGDFGHIVSTDKGNSMWVGYPSIIFYLPNAKTGSYTSYWDFGAHGATKPLWITPMMASPTDSKTVYVAGGYLSGSSGSHILKMTANTSGSTITASELTYDFDAASGGGVVSAIACSPINSAYWYVLTSNGKFFRSDDNGNTWAMTNVGNLGANNLYGATIYPSKTTLGVVYIGGSGYSNPPAYKSTDHGQNFSAISTGLPSTHIFELTGNVNDSLIFAATSLGPYVYVVKENVWYDMKGLGAPDQIYWSVEYVPSLNTVRFATYGRGIWDFAINSGSSLGILQEQNDSQNITIYPNPGNGFFTLRSSTELINSTINITNVLGEKVCSSRIDSEKEEIDLSKQPKGIYLLQIKTLTGTLVKKIVINR